MSLNEASGFDKLAKYYSENKDKPWQEWLKVVRIFPRPGKQGLVGLFTGIEDDSLAFVFKISQNINYLAYHELAVMQSLNTIAEYCPHFCRSVGGLICEIDPTKRRKGNPFVHETKYTIEKEVLLTEYLAKSYKLYNYIVSDRISEDVLYSAVKQTLLAVAIAQRKVQFTHYDLHSNNIMMRRCSKDLVFLYVLDDDNQFCVPTHGHYPVIIDFGFSYSAGLENGHLWPTLNHTEVGFISDRFDPIADPKLFLVTVSDEIHEERGSSRSRKLKNITKNLYQNLKIDWTTGWDNDTDRCATDYVLKLVRKESKMSKLFRENEYFCMDILQTLIVIPLEKQPLKNLHVAYTAFLREFVKIENEVNTPFYCLYILKGLVDAARTVRHDYRNPETRAKAVDYFRLAILERIDSVAKFCSPKDVKYERMLCSLLCFSRCMEGILYEALEKRMSQKNKLYKSVPLKTPEEICAVIDINLDETYQFNDNTTVLVLDCMKNSCYPLELTADEITDINGYSNITRGTELYKKISCV